MVKWTFPCREGDAFTGWPGPGLQQRNPMAYDRNPGHPHTGGEPPARHADT